MKRCILCHSQLGFVKFKSLDGYVCKQCYEIVSLNFTQTIKTRSLNELRNLYEIQTATIARVKSSTFEITRRINQLVLFDDQSQQICLPNNPKYAGKGLFPEYYAYTDVINCQVKRQNSDYKGKMLSTIGVEINFDKGKKIIRRIQLVANPVDPQSAAFKTMSKLAHQITVELQKVNPAALNSIDNFGQA